MAALVCDLVMYRSSVWGSWVDGHRPNLDLLLLSFELAGEFFSPSAKKSPGGQALLLLAQVRVPTNLVQTRFQVVVACAAPSSASFAKETVAGAMSITCVASAKSKMQGRREVGLPDSIPCAWARRRGERALT
jgi:hypothetical protein